MTRFQLLMVFVIFLGLGSQTQAQTIPSLAWSPGVDLPETRTGGVAVLAPDDAIIILGGESPIGSRVVRRLVVDGLNWGTSSVLDTDRIFPGAVRPGNTSILVYGGTGGGEASNEALAYDYFFGDSLDLAQLGIARRLFSFAADSLGHAYALGGLDDDGNVLFDAEFYDPGLDQWAPIIDLPDARFASSAVGDTNGNVFVLGGEGNSGIVGNVFCFSTTENSWVELAPMPVAVRNSVAVIFDGMIYVLGGVSSAGPVVSVQIFDLATGVWSVGTDLPAARHSHAALVDSLGQIVVIGGFDSNDVATSTVFHSQSLSEPETLPVVDSLAITNASLDRSYSYDVVVSGNPVPILALVQSPAGMTIDSSTGLISWQPVAGQEGFQDVTVRASNRIGDTDQLFTITVAIDTFSPTIPTNLQVVSVGTTTVELSWIAATDAVGVDHYEVYTTRRCGTRFRRRTCHDFVLGNIVGTSATVAGLTPFSSANYVVRAFDAAGNSSPGFSNGAVASTLSEPIDFQYQFVGQANRPISGPAKTLLEFQLTSRSNPEATYSLVAGPSGMTVLTTGEVQWTPAVADVGLHTSVFQASNSVGSSQLSVAISILDDIPQLSYQFSTARDAVAGVPFSVQVNDASNTPPTFQLIAAPAGMTINSLTGVINWLPTGNDGGATAVVVRATSAGGTADITINFYTHFTNSVSGILVTDLTALNPIVTWTAPAGPGVNLIQGYTLNASATFGVGRARRTQRLTFNSLGIRTQFALTGLTAGRLYKLSIHANDAVGNRGLPSSPAVEFSSRPAIPIVGWTVTNGLGGTQIIASQAVVIQLTDFNLTSMTTTFSIINAPAGLTLDSVTGRAVWTPSVADIGPVSIALRAANPVGPRDVVIPVNVLFSGPVQNLVGGRIFGTTPTNLSWDPPTDNVLPVASYNITRKWTFAGSHRTSSTFTIPGTSTSVIVGGKANLGITVTPVDGLGRSGASMRAGVAVLPAPPPPAPTNTAPIANAGLDKAITFPHTAVTLDGTASDDGLPNPPGAVTSSWSVVSGPGPVIFGNANAASTTVTFLVDGTYMFRLVVSDSVLSHQDDVMVTVSPEPVPTNTSPVSNAGGDQNITLPSNSVTLNGSATDDGLPNVPGTLSLNWSVVSGPDVVTFGNGNAANTTVQFSVDGTYTLRFTASDGGLTGTDDVIVTVHPAPSVPQPAPNPGTPPPFDPFGEQIELEGVTIQEVGSNFIVVSGIKIWVASTTVIKFEEGNGSTFALGQSVQVKASQNGDGSATAKKIQVGG